MLPNAVVALFNCDVMSAIFLPISRALVCVCVFYLFDLLNQGRLGDVHQLARQSQDGVDPIYRR